MSLLRPVAVDTLGPDQAMAAAAGMQTSLGEYMGQSFLQGLDESVAGRIYEELTTPSLAKMGQDDMTGLPFDYGGDWSQKITQDEWKASPSYRPEIPWDDGMTKPRAEALAQSYDQRRWRDSLYQRYQGGLAGRAAGIAAQFAGGSLSPENYIPILGPAARAAMVARLGRIGGTALTAATEGLIGTAATEPIIASTLRARGEQYGVAEIAADLLLGTAIGGAFGAAVGGYQALRGTPMPTRAPRPSQAPLTPQQLARETDALNVAMQALDAGEPVNVGAILQIPKAPEGIDVYHGTGHRFDRFDIEKVGEGEGNQSFGRGLYFAENRGVAESYRRQIGQKVEMPKPIGLNEAIAYLESGRSGDASPDVLRVIDEQRESIENDNVFAETKRPLTDEEILKDLVQWRDHKPGHLYKVRLAVSPDKLLDYDQPLSKQPAPVQKALADIRQQHGLPEPEDVRAGDYLGFLEKKLGSPKAAADALREAGVPGLRYFDAGSRGADNAAPTRNYVVFDDKLVGITHIDDVAVEQPTPPHPSVAEAAPRVGAGGDELDELMADAGLEDLAAVDAELEALRKDGRLTEADENELAAASDDAKQGEGYATAYETLATCVVRFT